jgi:hypothetical protein
MAISFQIFFFVSNIAVLIFYGLGMKIVIGKQFVSYFMLNSHFMNHIILNCMATLSTEGVNVK